VKTTQTIRQLNEDPAQREAGESFSAESTDADF